MHVYAVDEKATSMSNDTTYRKIDIECPVCSNVSPFGVFDTLELTNTSERNANGKPSLWHHATTGSIFTFRCKKCGFREPMTYKLTCLDSVHGLLMTVVEDQDDRDEAQETFENMALRAPSIICRMVESTEDLSEKLRIARDGHDDRVIELCKSVIIMHCKTDADETDEYIFYEDPTITCRYSEMQGDELVFSVEGTPLTDESSLSTAVYKKMKALLPPRANMRDLFLYDTQWADDVLNEQAGVKK